MKRQDKLAISKIIENAILDNTKDSYLPSKDEIQSSVDFIRVVECLSQKLNIQIKNKKQ